jgi:hypothetical protein
MICYNWILASLSESEEEEESESEEDNVGMESLFETTESETKKVRDS